MDFARLPDADLLQFVRASGELLGPAADELEERHLPAVRMFASICAPSAADALTEQAWRRALQAPDESAAVLPHALRSVLLAAAEYAEEHRSSLDADLAMWLGAFRATITEGTPGEYEMLLRRNSVTARAFGTLSGILQTAMWHHFVEHADLKWIARLLGADTAESQQTSVLIRRGFRDFCQAYEQILQQEGTDECRRLHRMVLAYADDKNANAADVIPHLQQCRRCSATVTDLERMYENPGGLLAESVLPWGGKEYASARAGGRVSATIEVPEQPGWDVPSATASGVSSSGAVPGPDRPTSVHTRRDDDASAAAPRRPMKTLTALGVCSLAVVITYASGLGPRWFQSSGDQSARQNPAAPGPSESAPDAPGPVRGAALEWLFEDAKGGVTDDSSGNGRDGNLVGDRQPKLLGRGGIAFYGQQSVASEKAVFDTDDSFSVSARVKLRNKDEYQTVASQDGSEVSSFQLQYDPSEDRWEMRMHRTDAVDSAADEAESKVEPRAGRWTYLTGVWDQPREEIRLYVDGKLQDRVKRKEDWSREGKFAVGRARLGDQYIRGFEGTIDDVRAFPKVLSGEQVRKLARKS